MSSLEVLQRVAEIAAKAGIQGEIDEENEHFVAGFELPEGRSQMVYVRPTAGGGEDSFVVTIFSPCHVFKKGLFKGISKEQCIELLQLNEKLTFARYGMWESEKEQMIVASVDNILDTLDPPEFEAAVWHVAMGTKVNSFHFRRAVRQPGTPAQYGMSPLARK